MEDPQHDNATRRLSTGGAGAALSVSAFGGATVSSASGESAAPGGISLPQGTRLGEFELVRVIGEGGFSTVYLAWDHSLHRSVAIKEYIPTTLAVRDGSMKVTVRSEQHREAFDAGLRSFVNEARLLASFDHPSFVKVYRFWEARGTAFMAMPCYEGPTLKTFLRDRNGPVDQAWLLRLLAPLTEALETLHAQNCYHRDVAPDNIILQGDAQTPVLLDFGAARRIVVSLTQNVTVILKRGFAPLEQYSEVPGIAQGPWTDVYALAATAYLAICGKTPPPAVGRAINDTFQPLSSMRLGAYSANFLQAIDRGLAVRPEDRIPSMPAFAQALGLRPAQRAQPAAPPRPLAQAAPSPPSTLGPASPLPSAGMAHPPAPRRDPAPRAALHTLGHRGFWVALGVSCLVLAGVAHWALSSPVPKPSPSSAAATPPVADAGPADASSRAAPAAVTLNASRGDRVALAQADQARERLDNVLAQLTRVGTAEKRDVSQAVNAALDQRARASAAVATGQYAEAASLYNDAAAHVSAAQGALVAELVQEYGKVAQAATQAKQMDIARQALNRAKSLRAMMPDSQLSSQ